MADGGSDLWLTIDQAAHKFRVSTGVVRQLIEQRKRSGLRCKTLRLVEDKWLVEHWMVAQDDMSKLIGTG